MGWLSKIGDAFSAPFKVARGIAGGLLGGGGGGKSSSASNVSNTTNLSTKINNVIDTTALAEVSKNNSFALNKTLKGFSNDTTVINKGTQAINKNIANTLQVLAQNSVTDNKQQDAIMKGGAVIVSGLLTYLAIKNNRGKNGK